MAEGYHLFAAAEVLTAANTNDYLMRQNVMRFADASARDTALSGVLVEGMVAYLKDVNTITTYDGSAWIQVLTLGAWTAYTPTSASWVIGNGTVSGSYQKVGRMVTVRGAFTLGSTSVPASALVLSVPVAAVAAQWVFGGSIVDVSGGVTSPAMWLVGSSASTALAPYALSAVTQINNAGVTPTVPWTWATGDSFTWLFTYEAAS